MFGGAYGSGRETVTFVSTYGPWGGVLATVVMALAFGLILAVCFEFARVFRVYEYASFSSALLKRAAVAYRVVLGVGLVLALGVGATAAGATLEDHFGVPAIVGTMLLMLAVVLLTLFGRSVIEWSMTATAGLLLAFLIGLVTVVIRSSGSIVMDTFAQEPFDSSFWQLGGLNAVLNASFLPLIMFIAVHIRTRPEAVVSGMFSGLVFALPSLALHVTFMSSYPAILDEEVPSYVMAETFGSPLFLSVFVIILFVLIVQTSVGITQGLIERVEAWSASRLGRVLTHIEHGGVAAAISIATVGLSVMGLVNLVATGYGLLSIAFLLTFTLPLLTIGVWRVRKAAVGTNSTTSTDEAGVTQAQ